MSTPVVAAAAGKILKAPVRAGRGVPEITDAYTKKCSCRREKTIVFCRACGYYCNGRIRLQCEKHPRVSLNYLPFSSHKIRIVVTDLRPLNLQMEQNMHLTRLIVQATKAHI